MPIIEALRPDIVRVLRTWLALKFTVVELVVESMLNAGFIPKADVELSVSVPPLTVVVPP